MNMPPLSTEQHHRQRTLLLWKAILIVFWSGVIGSTVVANVPGSPLRPKARIQKYLILAAPEGWGFFTKDPREPQSRAYFATGERWQEALGSSASFENAFGFLKKSRYRYAELAYLRGITPSSAWKDCELDVASCAVPGQSGATSVISISFVRELCGELLLEDRKPVPWAWSGRMKGAAMPGRVAHVNVDCEERDLTHESMRETVSGGAH